MQMIDCLSSVYRTRDAFLMHVWLIRHAKSDWSTTAASDFERPLNRRGKQDGPRMVPWLASQSDPATWIWCSEAVRAASTGRFVEAGFTAAGPTLIHDPRLYNATADTLLGVLRETPEDVSCAAVIAHNPGMTQLVNLLAGEQVTDNLPTFGFARLALPSPWSDVGFGAGALELLTSPKRLDGVTR